MVKRQSVVSKVMTDYQRDGLPVGHGVYATLSDVTVQQLQAAVSVVVSTTVSC